MGLDPDRDERRESTDAELVMQVRQGNAQAFDVLARRYQRALARVARSRLGRADWADDVVQEALLAAFRSCGSYDPRYSFRTWLWTILLNQCYHHYQRRSRRAAHECQPPEGDLADVAQSTDPRCSPLETLLAKERDEQLELLLCRLSEAQADALRLRFFGGLKFYEIAETMQCSLNTAKQRVRQGLIRMAGMLSAAADGAARQNPAVKETTANHLKGKTPPGRNSARFGSELE